MQFIGLVLILCLFQPSVLIAQVPTSDVFETQLEEISKEVEQNKEKIQKKQSQKRNAEKNLGKLTRELRYTELKLRRAKKKLKQTSNLVSLTKDEVSEAKKEFDAQSALFSDRIRQIYKNHDLGFLNVLFAPKDLGMMMESSYYFEKVIENDVKMIEVIQDKYDTLVEKQKRLNKQIKTVRRLESDIKNSDAKLRKQRKKQAHYIAYLKTEISEIEKRNEALEEASEEIAKLIRADSKGQKGFFAVGSFIKPVKGWLSSRFGSRRHPIFKRIIKHNGVDFAAPTGYKIKAANSGFVLVAGQRKKYRGYGKVTVIDHGKRPSDGKQMSSLYAHQSRILVKPGDFVKKGDTIGWVGSTGYSTGPHLHFEIRLNGKPVDPLKYLILN